MRKRLWTGLLIFILAVSMVGCGKSSNETTAEAQDVSVKFSQSVAGYDGGAKNDTAAPSTAASAESKPEAGDAGEGNTSIVPASAEINQKIIFTGQVDYQTLDFEKTRNDLNSYMTSMGAFIQNSSVQGGGIGYQRLKSAMFVYRIPKDRYNQAFVDMKKFGTVVFEQSSGEDVTERYFDTEARLKSLKMQQERLLALLDKATKMEDILKIEKELQTTQYDIENLTGTLKKWDSLVEYSTLTVNIQEVEQIKPLVPTEKDGLFKRIAAGFKSSISGLWDFTQNLLIFLAAAIPVLLPLGVIAYILYRILRKRYSMKIKKTGRPVQDIQENKSEQSGKSGDHDPNGEP